MGKNKNSEFSVDDVRHDGYSVKHRSGKRCVTCGKPAGTAWSPHFCPTCDIERKASITKSLENMIKK